MKNMNMKINILDNLINQNDDWLKGKYYENK